MSAGARVCAARAALNKRGASTHKAKFSGETPIIAIDPAVELEALRRRVHALEHENERLRGDCVP